MEVKEKNAIFAFHNIKKEIMGIVTLDKKEKTIIDWVNPHSEKVTLEEYCNEMQAAENSGFIGFEEHKKNMNQWLTTKL